MAKDARMLVTVLTSTTVVRTSTCTSSMYRCSKRWMLDARFHVTVRVTDACKRVTDGLRATERVVH